MARVSIDTKRAAALLGTQLRPAIEAGALGIAAAIQDEVAPYPPAPPRRPKRGYYIRGKGSFSAKGKLLRSSELLNRRWDMRTIPMGARLRNLASYAGDVHGRSQTKRHAQTGWVTVVTGIETVVNGGQAAAIMMDAISRALAGKKR